MRSISFAAIPRPIWKKPFVLKAVQARQAKRPARAADTMTPEALTGVADYTPEEISTPVHIPSVLQDAAVTALDIPYTAVSSGVSAANLLTGGLLDPVVAMMDKGQEVLRQGFASDELNRQIAEVQNIRQDKEKGLDDFLVTALSNPRYLAHEGIRNLGSMALPVAASGGAVNALPALAKAAPAISKSAPVLGRAAGWLAKNPAAVGTGASQAANALMNAGDTFSSEEMRKRSLAERYGGAGVAGTLSLIAGALTEGGAEGQIARRLLNGKGEIAGGILDYLKKLGQSAAKEGAQEVIEESGNYLGELFGTGKRFDLNEWAKQSGEAGLLGAITGGVTNIGTQAGGREGHAAQQFANALEDAVANTDIPVDTDAAARAALDPNPYNVSSLLTNQRTGERQKHDNTNRQGKTTGGDTAPAPVLDIDTLNQALEDIQGQDRQQPVQQQLQPQALQKELPVQQPVQPATELDNPLDVIIANGGIRRSVLENDFGWTAEQIGKLPEGVVTDNGSTLLVTKRALKKAGMDTDVPAILDAASRPAAPEMEWDGEQPGQQEASGEAMQVQPQAPQKEAPVQQQVQPQKTETAVQNPEGRPESGMKQIMRDAVETGSSADGHILFRQVTDQQGENSSDTQNIPYEKQIDDLVSGKSSTAATLGHPSNQLKAAGLPDNPLRITKDVVGKLGEKHGLTIEQIKRLPNLLASPVMVFRSATREGSFVVVVDDTAPTKKGFEPIVAAINPNGEIMRAASNIISSAYGRNRFGEAIQRWTDDGLLVAAQKETVEKWLTIRGLQLPKMVQAIQNGSIVNLSQVSNDNKLNQQTGDGQDTPAQTVQEKPASGRQPPLGERAPSNPSVSGSPISSARPGQSGIESNVTETPAPDNQPRNYGNADNPDTEALALYFQEQFSQGRQYKNINEARADVARLLGVERPAVRNIHKQIDEAIELGLVNTARDIVSRDARDNVPAKDTYDKLVRLYEIQPNLGVRTSTSVAQQAYSTPLPLAFLASRLAGIDSNTTVYEPTAGNGALLIGANPQNIIANELNTERANRLRSQGMTVTEKDATQYTPDKTPDAVIANPPFGTVKEENGQTRHFDVLGLDTTEIDQAIALKALHTLPENGRAVLIIGGKKGSDKARSNKYNTAAQRAFYKTLFDNFNVVDHFSVDGKLYARQGAGYPIDFIVIDGHHPTENPVYPAGKLPPVYDSFDALKEKLNGRANHEKAVVRGQRPDTEPVHGRRDNPGQEPAAFRDGMADGEPSGGSGRGSREVGDIQGLDERTAESGNPDLHRKAGSDGQSAHVDTGSPGRNGQSGVDNLPSGQSVVPAETGTTGGRGEPGRSDDMGHAGRHDAPQRGLDVKDSPEQKAKKQEKAQSRETPAAKTNQPQRPYRTHSSAESLNTLVPANMETPVRNALERVSQKHGDIDSFVAGELGYASVEAMHGAFAAEQIDALALALDNIKSGKGFVLGDQTGIGKGRVCAGIIRWAKLNGKTPVFVTMLPDLYADMMRDLNDIGTTGFTPFITNRDLTGKKALMAPDGSKLAAAPGKKYDSAVKHILSGRTLPEGYDAVFTTYKQLQAQKNKPNDRQEMLKAIQDNAILILDEAHNAGGADSSVGKFIRAYTANMPGGVLYSSATFAKRPDIMSLYNKTDISRIGTQEAIQAVCDQGGLPIQQAISAMLTESGQYIRRERSFEGASMDTLPVSVDVKMSDNISAAMEKIMRFSNLVQATAKGMDKSLKAAGRALSLKKGVGDTGAKSTSFGSVMHNLVSVVTMASKAEAAINAVEQAVKNGEKPVITLSNTLGSAIENYVKENGLQKGEAIGLTFNDLLLSYLDKTRTIRITKPGEKEGKDHYLTDEELGKAGVTAYKETKAWIDSLDLSLPVSPIDAIRDGLAKRGIKAGEITGRTHGISYEGANPAYRPRETSVAEKQKAAREFNAGGLDCLIINQSGSTGISLHASEKFADQRRRNMIILQPDLNIDVFMQTLGRVFRTGQVVPPKYSFTLSNIPSEKRPAAVLGKKMSSLNANTTASAKGTQSFTNIPDFLNVYGDQAARDILSEDAELNARLGYPLPEDPTDTDGLVARMTGRIPLLSVSEQEDVYERLETAYQNIIALEDAKGTNVLDTTAKPLDARKISEKAFTPSGGDSPFEAGSVAVTYDVKRLGKPYRSEEVKEHIKEGKASDDANPQKLADLVNAYRKKKGNLTEKESQRISDNQRLILDIAEKLKVGRAVRVTNTSGTSVGIVVGIRNTGKAGQNPTALSRWQITVDLADANRRITIPFSKLSLTESAEGDQHSVVPFRDKSMDALFADFDSGQNETREQRVIVTGNLVKAFTESGKGKIITFDTSEGERIVGLMLPADASVDEMLDERPVKFDKGSQALAFLERTRAEISTKDGMLTIDNFRGYHVRVPAAKATGGKYYLAPDILKITGDFTKYGSFMQADLTQSQVEKLVALMNEKGTPLLARGDIAREVTGQGKTKGADVPVFSRGKTTAGRGSSVEAIQRELDKIKQWYRNAPELVVVEKPSDLPFDAPDNAKGAYWRGRCFFVQTNIANAADTRDVFGHEVLRHFGLRHFFGDRLNAELDFILTHNKNVREAAQKWIKNNTDYISDVRKHNPQWTQKQFTDWRRNIATEEALAHMKGNITGMKKLVYAIQKLLRAIGLNKLADSLEARTDAEALMLLHKAEVFVKGKEVVDPEVVNHIYTNFLHDPDVPVFSRQSEESGAFENPQSFAIPQITVLDNLIPSMQDKDIDIKRVQDAIVKSGGNLTEQTDVYLGQTLYTSKVTDRLDRLNDEWTKPILEAVRKSGLTLEEAGDWLYARHVIEDEVNAKLAEINPDREDNDALSGMTDDEAQAILDDNRNNAALKELGELADRLARRNIQWLVQGGLLTREEGQAWADKYRHYVPLKRDSDKPREQTFGEWIRHPLSSPSEKPTRRGNVTGAGNMTVKGDESRRRMGSSKRATNIIANMMANASSTIIRSEKAAVGRQLLDLARANPNPDLWTVDTPEKVKRINRETGLVEVTYRDPDKIPPEHVLVTKENGVEHWIRFNKESPRAVAIAKAMKALDAPVLPWIFRAVGTTTRYMAKWITTRNPVFMLFNFQRDVQHAVFNLSDTPLSGKEGQVLKAILPAMRQYRNLIRGDGEQSGYAAEFKEAGAETGFIKTFESIHDRVSDLQKELDKMGRGKADPRVWAEKMVRAIDDYNSIAENGVRLAVYTVARENGQSIREAARISKEITVDFNRRGTHSGMVNAVYMFANAGIQGHARLFRAIGRSKKARIMAAGLVGVGFVMDMLGRALLGDDDETGKKVWDEIPDFDKERNWIIPAFRGKEKYLKIPLPQGLHVLPNIGRMLSELCFSSKKKDPLEMAMRAALLITDAFNPFGAAASPGQFIAPTIAKPIVQIWENNSFAGSKLYRDETAYGGYTPPAYQRTWKNTPGHWASLSKMLNDVTGGDDVEAGKLDMPPEVIRHIVTSYLVPGTSGNLDKLAGAIGKGSGATTRDWPVLSRMVGEAPDEREKERAVYDRLGEVRKTINAIHEYEKQERMEDATRLVRKLGGGNLSKGARMLKHYDGLMKEMRDLNREKRQAEKEQNANALKVIEAQRKHLFNEFLNRM
ncbi:MAG: strawberry notch C-terminal domain-containing protein [Oxalobacter formigenes]|nr:strawberry notch C-terminal domain-containing protein [Oxalobacter formigenes]